MRKSFACAVVARRLNLSLSRVEALIQRVSEANLLPSARGSDRPDLGSLELARLFLAAVCDRGLGKAATVAEFSALRSEHGATLIDLIEGMIAGHVPTTGLRSMTIQLDPPGASIVAAHHMRFGAEQSRDGVAKTILIPGGVFAAICSEFRGMSPDEADHATALGQLAAALH